MLYRPRCAWRRPGDVLSDFGMPAAYAVLVWWFATGIILFLDGLPRWTFRWSMGAATTLLTLVAVELRASSGDLSAGGAYTAFTCAIAVWGWLEMGFLMGFITGPRKHGCASSAVPAGAIFCMPRKPSSTTSWPRSSAPSPFCRHSPRAEPIGLYTYLILWSMRLSAKLNLFLGVPNLGEKFLPAHLQYLKGFFRKRSMNILFPLSVTPSTIVVVLLVQRYLAVTDPFNTRPMP